MPLAGALVLTEGLVSLLSDRSSFPSVNMKMILVSSVPGWAISDSACP